MEACLEIYGFYRPNIKRTIVGILCIAILTGSVFSRKAVGTKEYLSAKKQEETRNEIAVSKMERIVTAGSQEIIVSEPDKTVMAEEKDNLAEKVAIVDKTKASIVDAPKDIIVDGTKDIITDTPKNTIVDETKDVITDESQDTIADESNNIPKNDTEEKEDARTDIAETTTPFLIDGVLYDEEEITLLAFPSGRTGGYIVPTQTERIAANAFAQTGLSVIDIRDCGPLLIEDDRAAQLVRCEQ